MVACEAAYRHGEPWRQELIAYLRGNRDYVAEFIATELPHIKSTHVEATCLMWLDVTACELADPWQHVLDHKVRLSPGRDFADKGFLRLNFGCPRSVLVEVMGRLKGALAV